MAKTTDGGATWSRVITPLFANAKIINTAWFVNDNKGYIGGEVEYIRFNSQSYTLPITVGLHGILCQLQLVAKQG